MKKGLLTILAASLVFVGCQNYDDQFDDLNAQISALKSQVDGLGSLSSQVASLSGTISGLQSGVAAAQAAANAATTAANASTAAANAAEVAASGIDLSALSASLAELETDIAAVQASLASTATAAAVTTLQAEIDAIEADVDELLSTSNIYDTAVSVTSASTLDAALALGNKLNILNAAATITVSTAMDQAKVQTLVNRIHTMTGNLIFNSSSTTETTFENLTSASGIFVSQKGGYNFKNLTSAAAIQLNDEYKANITVINFAKLATVTSIATTSVADADTAHTISFNQATEVHLDALARYPGSSLTIVTKEGGALTMGILDDKDLLGLYEATSVTLTGPASFTTTLLEDGALSFTNVATVNVTDYRGTIAVNTGVVTFTGTDIAFLTVDSGADDLTSLTADMKRDDADDLTAANIAALEHDASGGNNGDISLSGLANLQTATITGSAGDIVISTNPNLTTVVISADSYDLTMADDDNLTSVTVTGAKFHDVSVTDHADLVTLTLDHTTKLPEVSTTASADEKAASLTVTGNASLTTLTNSSDDIDALTVTGNAVLATVNFAGLADDGSATVTTAAVYDNNLALTLFKNGYDTGTAYTTTDTGSITTTSGVDTLKAWLDAVVGAASATAGVYVFVDQIDKYEVQSTLNGAYTDTAVPSAPSVTTEATANSNKTSIYAIVAKQGAETGADTGVARSETMTQVFPITNNAIFVENTQLSTNEGFAINVAGLSKSFMVGDTYGSAANGSTVQTVADMIAFINADTSWSGTGVSITASNAGYLRSLQEVNYTDDLGAAQTISVAGAIWYKLGSTTVSGATADFTAGEGAAAIANELARLIEAHTSTNVNSIYNATANGAVVEIRQAVSVSGYADDVTSGASVPTITFVIDAAQTSTTALLGEGDAEDINTYSGSVANATVSNAAIQGGTNGFNLSVDVHEVQGVNFKLVNTSTTVTRFGAAPVQPLVLHIPGATSPTIGRIGLAGGLSQTTNTGYSVTPGVDSVFDTDSPMATSSTLASAIHVMVTAAGGANSHTTLFTEISSVTAGSVTQAAAITDRTGWL